MTFWPKSNLEAGIYVSTVIILVAEVGNKVVGFVIVNCNQPLSKAEIENIYVHPAKRRQGIGSQLVRAALAEAKKRSYEFISVLTPPNDIAAIKTYENAGFVKGKMFLWLDYSESEQFRKRESR